MQVVTFAEKSARKSRGVRVYLAEVRLNAAKVDRGYFAGLGANCVRLLPPVDIGGDISDSRAAFFDRVGILQGQWLPQPLLQGPILVVRSLVPPRNECR